MKNEILKFLKGNASGKGNSKKADEICNHLQNKGHRVDKGRTQEEIRGLIKILVEDDGELIGSTSNGYYYINSKDDAQEAINNLSKRADNIKARAEKIKDLWNIKNPNQKI